MQLSLTKKKLISVLALFYLLNAGLTFFLMIENSGKIGGDNCYSKFMGYKNSRFGLLIIYL